MVQEGDVGITIAVLNDGFDYLVSAVVDPGFTTAEVVRQLGLREAGANGARAQGNGAEGLADLTILIAVDEHLGSRYGREPKGGWLTNGRFLEEEGGAANGDEIEEALMHLDREVRASEMPLES
jgi:hypothetical protein